MHVHQGVVSDAGARPEDQKARGDERRIVQDIRKLPGAAAPEGKPKHLDTLEGLSPCLSRLLGDTDDLDVHALLDKRLRGPSGSRINWVWGKREHGHTLAAKSPIRSAGANGLSGYADVQRASSLAFRNRIRR